MPVKILCELDPVFETMGLLLVSHNSEAVKEEMMKALSELGVDGEQFYSQHLKIYDKYVKAFTKNRVECKEDELFFNEKDSSYCLILMSLITENRSWLTSPESLTDDKINSQIIHIIKTVLDNDMNTEFPDTLEGIIQLLDRSELETTAKWKMLRIMRQPTKHIAQLVNTVNSNTEAFRKAVEEVGKPLEKLLIQYNEVVRNNGDKEFHELMNKFAQSATIYPSLIFPASQFLFDKSCYYGLLSNKVKNRRTRLDSNKALLIKLKALSDSSKLEIISSLKASPKYNLEIAQQLGLTAATMSHHMNFLLNCGFVRIEKKDGKVYYHLEKENLKDLIKELEETLL